MPSTNILIVEPTSLVRHLLCWSLAAQPDFRLVGATDNGMEAVELACALKPDVIVMAPRLPLLNGIAAAEQILARYPDIRVITLSSQHDLSDLGRLAGAFDCLEQNCQPEELIASIRRASRSRIEGCASPLLQRIVRIAKRSSLSAFQMTVLECIIDPALTMEEVAETLTVRMSRPISKASVKSALGTIFQKLRLEPRTRSALVRYVHQMDSAPISDPMLPAATRAPHLTIAA